jgi:hypothetical protein
MEVDNARLLNHQVTLRLVFNNECFVWTSVNESPDKRVIHRLGEFSRFGKWAQLWCNTCPTLRSQFQNEPQHDPMGYDRQNNNAPLIQRAEKHHLWRFNICFQCQWTLIRNIEVYSTMQLTNCLTNPPIRCYIHFPWPWLSRWQPLFREYYIKWQWEFALYGWFRDYRTSG